MDDIVAGSKMPLDGPQTAAERFSDSVATTLAIPRRSGHGGGVLSILGPCLLRLAALNCAAVAIGCSARTIDQPDLTGREIAILDKLEGEDAQVEINEVLGLCLGQLCMGKVERGIYRVPGATAAEVETNSVLNAQGQVIQTRVKTRISAD